MTRTPTHNYVSRRAGLSQSRPAAALLLPGESGGGLRYAPFPSVCSACRVVLLVVLARAPHPAHLSAYWRVRVCCRSRTSFHAER
jgi:hypothetical protein